MILFWWTVIARLLWERTQTQEPYKKFTCKAKLRFRAKKNDCKLKYKNQHNTKVHRNYILYIEAVIYWLLEADGPDKGRILCRTQVAHREVFTYKSALLTELQVPSGQEPHLTQLTKTHYADCLKYSNTVPWVFNSIVLKQRSGKSAFTDVREILPFRLQLRTWLQ